MAKKRSLWKRFRFRLEVIAAKAAVTFVPKLSRKAMLGLARGLSRLAYHVDRRGRAIAETNLRRVFPDMPVKERRNLTRACYRHQAVSVLDLMWAPRNLSAVTSARYVRYEYEDEADFLRVEKGATIWVTPHYGTFEWLSIEWALTRTKPTIVAEDFKNPALTKIFTKLRQYSGITIIPQERAMVRLLKHVKRGGQTAFLTDLRVTPSKAATVIKCFGLKTSVTILHAFLAKQTGAPILPVICLPQEDGTYVFKFYKSFHAEDSQTPQAIAQHCWDVFEAEIRKRPAPWIWMYKQWRYLPESAGGTKFPNYAKAAPAFNELDKRESIQ